MKILIAEDHELTRMGMVALLKQQPSVEIVGEVSSGERIEKMVESTQPEIVLMDIGMPVLNGIEATKIIKQKFPEVKVIILTSYNQSQEVFASLAAGADAYCLKDIKMERLVQVMETVIEGASWLDPSIAKLVLTSLPTGESDENAAKAKNYKTSLIGLTEREVEILKLIVEGKSNKEIADVLFITINTVKAHVRSVIQKMSVNDRTQAAVKALKQGLISL